jgi:imidazoleglycerol phosphate dehydratase HisB
MVCRASLRFEAEREGGARIAQRMLAQHAFGIICARQAVLVGEDRPVAVLRGQDLGATVVGLVDAVLQALGNKKGINRAGYFLMPMDETLAVAAIDLSGRPFPVVDLKNVTAAQVGDLPVELVQDFFEGFANAARANVHVKVLYGRSSHHQIEAVFKAVARALRVACAKDKRLAKMLPSTKGLL